MAYVRVKIDGGPFIASVYVDDAKIDDGHRAVSAVLFDELVRQEIGDRKADWFEWLSPTELHLTTKPR